MKRLFVWMFALASNSLSAQEHYQYTYIDSVQGATASELYSRAQRWFVSAFQDAKAVIQLDDPRTTTILGVGMSPYRPVIFTQSEGRKGLLRFQVEVSCKEGKYRLQLTEFRHESILSLGTIMADSLNCGNGKPFMASISKICLKEALPQVHAIEAHLQTTLKLAMHSTVSDSDW
jgi:hypothetical protein